MITGSELRATGDFITKRNILLDIEEFHDDFQYFDIIQDKLNMEEISGRSFDKLDVAIVQGTKKLPPQPGQNGLNGEDKFQQKFYLLSMNLEYSDFSFKSILDQETDYHSPNSLIGILNGQQFGDIDLISHKAVPGDFDINSIFMHKKLAEKHVHWHLEDLLNLKHGENMT